MAIKIFHIILLASIKYIVSLPYAMLIGLSYGQAVFSVLTGGIGGFLFFFYLSKPVFKYLKAVRHYICIIFAKLNKRKNYKCEQEKSNKKIKIFTKKNRFLARFKRSYGFWGIIIFTPLFLTIPLGAFLAGKYYSARPNLILYMIISITGWAAIISGLMNIFPKLFFD